MSQQQTQVRGRIVKQNASINVGQSERSVAMTVQHTTAMTQAEMPAEWEAKEAASQLHRHSTSTRKTRSRHQWERVNSGYVWDVPQCVLRVKQPQVLGKIRYETIWCGFPRGVSVKNRSRVWPLETMI